MATMNNAQAPQRKPYDQRLGAHAARLLAKTPVTPNQVTTFSLLLALLAAVLFATGRAGAANWAAGFFVLARLVDHVDGELARLTGKASRFGYYFDYVAGGVSYAALFAGVGMGLGSELGIWAPVFGVAGALVAIAALFLNLDLDKLSGLGAGETGEAVGYPRFGGFELEDGIYLIAPITWLGSLTPFFVAASASAVIYGLWTLSRVIRLRDQPHP